MIRAGYTGITDLFIDMVSRVNDTQWQQAGLGEWTVRELVGHTCRATFVLIEGSMDKPAAHLDIERPADFWKDIRTPADNAAIAEDGRQAAAALGNHPLDAVRETAERVRTRIDNTPDDTLITTRAGGMRLIDYLATRVFECTIHTLDLAVAIRAEINLPHPAATVALQLLGERAQLRGHVIPLLLAATGRRALPEGLSVL
ncbi:MAG: hypothetical protein ETSY1_06915 [Candidatus Entotheonella factor]|uniref:Mycothiol-dependent maleylpyruvate isomerase metal-binding domain-containing protein n=1 Tax=Entotheonella factor TaxID=1429438 RepID=W4LW08_ENTF1|nr:maleylpyruvate isomerase N-terminal domain-containing protein [Candidatus Entotheonella palauensis]ETX01567.1 MAG: hypothetical protein ETSY1_06915 [Candidatus Entotheonella factor]